MTEPRRSGWARTQGGGRARTQGGPAPKEGQGPREGPKMGPGAHARVRAHGGAGQGPREGPRAGPKMGPGPMQGSGPTEGAGAGSSLRGGQGGGGWEGEGGGSEAQAWRGGGAKTQARRGFRQLSARDRQRARCAPGGAGGVSSTGAGMAPGTTPVAAGAVLHRAVVPRPRGGRGTGGRCRERCAGGRLGVRIGAWDSMSIPRPGGSDG